MERCLLVLRSCFCQRPEREGTGGGDGGLGRLNDVDTRSQSVAARLAERMRRSEIARHDTVLVVFFFFVAFFLFSFLRARVID